MRVNPKLSLFLIPISYTAAANIPFFSSLGTEDRRELIKQAVIGAIVTALIAAKIAIRGPCPYQPLKNSLEGKVVIITGGNAGLGFESAKRLAKAGATVVITSRSVSNGERAVNEIKKSCEEEIGIINDRVYSLPLDLCDLDSVKAFPDALKKALGEDTSIGVLLNNAGVMGVPELELTVDGYERTFQTNHLGHFALTALIFPLLAKTGARIINVSSEAYQMAAKGLDFGNLKGEKSYGPWTSYAASKLENILFTKELQRRVDNASKTAGLENIKIFAVTPGVVRTNMLYRYFTQKGSSLATVFFKTLLFLPHIYISKSVERGATTQVWLASGQGKDMLNGGEYLENCKVIQLRAAAKNTEHAKELWNMSEKLSGVEFQI